MSITREKTWPTTAVFFFKGEGMKVLKRDLVVRAWYREKKTGGCLSTISKIAYLDARIGYRLLLGDAGVV